MQSRTLTWTDYPRGPLHIPKAKEKACDAGGQAKTDLTEPIRHQAPTAAGFQGECVHGQARPPMIPRRLLTMVQTCKTKAPP
jgi:hypothetical protein